MGGFSHLIDVHRGFKISEAQRQRFVELYVAAAEMPDARRRAVPGSAALHVEFGSKVAMQNSQAETDDRLHPLRVVPKWDRPENVETN